MMNRQSMTIMLFSVVAAIVLFLVANYFEDDSRWNLPESVAGGSNIMNSRTYYESPLQTISAADNCEQSEGDLVRIVEQARLCRTDDDCTIFDFGYPIQCLTSVAKNQIPVLRLEFRRYQANCDFRVYYDCPTGELDRRAVCQDNQCTVELTGVDELRDATLDYLGIE